MITVTLLWILLGPVIISLDTDINRYRMALPGIVHAAVVPAEDLFHIRGRIFFIPFKVHPFSPKQKKVSNSEGRGEKKKSRQKEKPNSLSEGMKLGRNILGSFRIRRMNLDIDTDDFLLNAWLLPAFSAVNSERIHMQVNFQGNASLMLDVRTRLGALAWAFIKTKYQSLFNY